MISSGVKLSNLIFFIRIGFILLNHLVTHSLSAHHKQERRERLWDEGRGWRNRAGCPKTSWGRYWVLGKNSLRRLRNYKSVFYLWDWSAEKCYSEGSWQQKKDRNREQIRAVEKAFRGDDGGWLGAEKGILGVGEGAVCILYPFT